VVPIRVATNTALKPITVGAGPDAIAISRDGRTAYVASSEANTVTPIRVVDDKALRPVKVGRQPDYLAITPDSRTVYAVDYTSDDGPGYVTPIRTCRM
jgi:DNA-binding beta-propeller fold protein YncE